MQMLRDIRCGKCNRLLARAGGIYQLQIKCARCGALNQVRIEAQDQLPSATELTLAQN
ncbi:Com family DNA-binding transcriptional regulator [Pseudomonas sp. 39004]|nr:Com family DNA-binding transcriptional regulator [Pseudomonas sp. 39004]MDD1958977.1 Com family DNA-binding transcriptional regulator [Pseudomonas sp. 39004]